MESDPPPAEGPGQSSAAPRPKAHTNPAPRPKAQAVPALRRNRDFQLLWGGQFVSVLGSQITKIAYPLLVLAMTGSPAKAGIAGFAAMLGYLLFPLFPLSAGALVDRLDRKRIMITCDAIRLAAVASIAVAGLLAHITYVQVLIAAFVEGSASVFFSLAQRAALPMIVHPSQRPVAVSQNEARNYGAQIAGPRGHRHRDRADPTRWSWFWFAGVPVLLGSSRRRRGGSLAEAGGERGQIEHVQRRVAPALCGRPVVEVAEALVRRVQDCSQDLRVRWVGVLLAFQDRRGLTRHH